MPSGEHRNVKGYAHPELLVEPDALAVNLQVDWPRVLLLDLRPAEQFAAGHLPGAAHLDLWGVSLIDTDPAPLRSFLWMIEHQLSSRGVAEDRPVVVYDTDSGVRSARAFWFLELFGHPQVRVLDGGYDAWVKAGLVVSTSPEAPVASAWAGDRQNERLANWRDVKARIGKTDAVILDTRSEGEYRGTTMRARRGGAIPGAVHLEWTRNLGPDGAFKPADELRRMYETVGVTPDREVITYCQGGYRAAHTYLALRLLGYPRVRNYVGSWKEWGDREDLPIETPEG